MLSRLLTRRNALASLIALPVSQPSDCSVWVFGLLRPTRLSVHPQAGSRLHCKSEAGDSVVEGYQRLSIDVRTAPVSITGPNESAVSFLLEIPGVIRRAYLGTLKIESNGALLVPVVSMNREVAVSSIVGAELPTAAAPLQALAAQAVVARSFLAATQRHRHKEAAFCDTTHCQFLRSPAGSRTAAAEAVRLTRQWILTANAEMIPARYSAACGGHTDNRREEGYLYQSVSCEICRNLGLSRRGHGLGLCQEGALGLARAGWRWRPILGKYYPGAAVQPAA